MTTFEHAPLPLPTRGSSAYNLTSPWPRVEEPLGCAHLGSADVDCGNGAMCPSGHRCTAAKPMSGLRGACEPESCDPLTTRGGPLNQTCWDQRLNAHLICKSQPAKRSGGGVVAGQGVLDLCSTLRSYLPGDCTVRNDCFAFTCDLELYGLGISVRQIVAVIMF